MIGNKSSLKRFAGVLDAPWAYRLWQAPFQSAKFAPIERHNDLTQVRRVLDVGCGPGTNCGRFPRANYVGLDINRRYVSAARRRYGRDFRAVDATTYRLPSHDRFDFVLANSLLHHMNDERAAAVLERLSTALTIDGHLHVIDLVAPDRPGIARYLANSDRGDFPRPVAAWRRLFEARFEPLVCEPFALTLLGGVLWEMVYFKGRASKVAVGAACAVEGEPCHAA